MKKDILIPGIIAVAVHIIILAGPVPRQGSTEGYVFKPTLVSMIRHEEPATSSSGKAATTKTGLKPHPPTTNKAALKKSPVPERKPNPKRPPEVTSVPKTPGPKKDKPETIVKPSADTLIENNVQQAGEPSVSPAPKVQGKGIESGSSITTASINKPTAKGKDKVTGRPKRYGSGQGTITYAKPKYKDNLAPDYPKIARRKGFEGRTLIRAEVLEHGKVGRMQIAASSGFDVLDIAALRSVKVWIFVPGTENGEKTRQWVIVPIRFALK